MRVTRNIKVIQEYRIWGWDVVPRLQLETDIVPDKLAPRYDIEIRPV